MSTKRCYFAYSWEDDNSQLPKFLEALKDMIETESEGEIEVIFDKKSFKTGDNFKEKENLIYVSNCIVIFFSPNYKAIVDKQDENKGVYREYKKIKEVREKKIASILPVIVEGDEDTSITNEFKDNIAQKINVNEVITKNTGNIKRQYIDTVKSFVKKVIKETNLASKKGDYIFRSEDEKIEILFGESEANEKLPHKCMYKTDAYISVMSQNIRYIVGRKGSGKTTFFELLEKYDAEAFEEKYKILMPIKADRINMQYVYDTMNSFECDNKLFPLHKRLDMFWKIYTHLCAIFIVCLEEELCKVEDSRASIFRKAGDVFRNDKFGVSHLNDEGVHEALFISAIETFDTFFRSCLVEYSKEKSFDSSLVANFNIDNVMENYFGKELYIKLKNAILKCKKKVIIALDGFNSVGETFRELTVTLLNGNNEESRKEGRKRLNFECLFYRTMFYAFEDLRKANRGIITKVSFCIIIPQDRIDQIKNKDRDFSKINFASLSWDAVDLLEMLVKRLEFVYGEVDSDDLIEKFEIIMKKNLKNIPLQITIKIDGKDSEIPLFEYLLRISFWRPRDIIKYFYEIYLANKNSIKGREELSSDTLKSILYNKARDIIEQEFYGEYMSVITNIEEIMGKFRGRNIMLELDEVYDILLKQDFETSTIREFNKPYNKLKILYELSVLGIWVDRNIRIQENLKCNLCFNYNEGLDPIDLLKNDRKFEEGKVRIVINPIFSKYLSLKYNTKEVLEDYGWEYLIENHIRKSSIKRV